MSTDTNSFETLDAAWSDFYKNVIEPVSPMPFVEHNAKVSFYAGATAANMIIIAAAAEHAIGPAEQLVHTLDKIKELTEEVDRRIDAEMRKELTQ